MGEIRVAVDGNVECSCSRYPDLCDSYKPGSVLKIKQIGFDWADLIRIILKWLPVQ